ncbi:hypothetical protein NMG60_11037394 [Bertholletia excelsa]
MASFSSSFSSFFSALLFMISMLPFLVFSHQFPVGGKSGWVEPSGNGSETYNHWASKSRFHVGDSLYFKYQKDSVLVVNKSDYVNCVTSNPISKFEDGETVFRFHRFGYFYFISGQPGHCKSGQRMIVQVMVHPEVEPPQSAVPARESAAPVDGGSWDSSDLGPPRFNGTTKLPVASYLMTALVTVFVVLYFFVE